MAEHESPKYNESITPAKEIVTQAYSDILTHNRSYAGLGALFANILKKTLNENGVDVQASDDLLEEGEMSASLQDVFHNDTFTRIGIHIGPFGSFNTEANNHAVTTKEIVPVVTSESLYSGYLGTLSPADVEDENTARLLGDVIANLNKIVDFAFADESINAMSPDERSHLAEAGEDALRTFVSIDAEYARLGVDSIGLSERASHISPDLTAALAQGLQYEYGGLTAELQQEFNKSEGARQKAAMYTSLSRKVDYWGRDILTEGIIADKKQYLVDPAEQGFGPTNWHKDGGQRYWAAALGFLMQIQEGDRTKEFGSEVKTGLLKSLDTALEEIEQSEEDLYYSSQKPDLENVRAAINGDAYDVQRFMTYTEPPDYSK